MTGSSNITGGVYLVVDPAMEITLLLAKLTAALEGGVKIVQIWNHWKEETDRLACIEAICEACKPYQVPVLINEDWKLLTLTPSLQGVHFDRIRKDYQAIKNEIGRKFLTGITCSNDLSNVYWAVENRFDYISFCSMFPSASAESCELVTPSTIKKARAIADIPVFVAGGITPDNIASLKKTVHFNGVAVISGILNNNNPKQQTEQYIQALNK